MHYLQNDAISEQKQKPKHQNDIVLLHDQKNASSSYV
jgi:hypothetical protein